MVVARRHPEPMDPTGPNLVGGRLNLLLSYSGWQPESWADQLPRLLEPMGIRALRVGTGREATAVIQTQPVHIAVVDLGLPMGAAGDTEEAGARILSLLARVAQPPPTVVVKRSRTSRDDRREICDALRHGAFAVIDRPRTQADVEILLEVLRRCLRRHYQGRWPGAS